MMIELLALLAGMNVVIGIAYFLLGIILILAPIKLTFLRALGLWGLLLLFFVVIFLMGCGGHHFEMAAHYQAGEGLIDISSNLIHFMISEVVQIVGAFGAAVVGVIKGRDFFDILAEEFEKHKRGENKLYEGEDE